MQRRSDVFVRRPKLPAARGLWARAIALYAVPVPLFVGIAVAPDAGARIALAAAAVILYVSLGLYLDWCAGRHAADVVRAVGDDATAYRHALNGRAASIDPATSPVLELD